MKPFDVICIKPFNTQGEMGAHGVLELLKIYRINQFSFSDIGNEKMKGVFEIEEVQRVDLPRGTFCERFITATHEKFQTDETVPIFREHLKKL